jgi:hypothetical protein
LTRTDRRWQPLDAPTEDGDTVIRRLTNLPRSPFGARRLGFVAQKI